MKETLLIMFLIIGLSLHGLLIANIIERITTLETMARQVECKP